MARQAVRSTPAPAEHAATEDLPAYRTKAEVATDVVRRAILSGDLTPGELLTVVSLAERFDLTHMPLREALSHLAAEGLVEIEPHQSARVVRLSHERMKEEYFVRAIVEAAAAAQATKKLDEAAFDALEDLLHRMDRARCATHGRLLGPHETVPRAHLRRGAVTPAPRGGRSLARGDATLPP